MFKIAISIVLIVKESVKLMLYADRVRSKAAIFMIKAINFKSKKNHSRVS